MYIKIHKSYRNVVAICDVDLMGKRFEEGKRQLEIKENFFKDKQVSKEEAIKILRKEAGKDSTFNIVGDKSIQTCIEAGIINEKSVDTIDNIPFTFVLI